MTPPPGPDASADQPAPAPTATPHEPAAWPAHAADLVVEVVDKVRDKTATPVLTISRAIVYGTAIVFLAIMAVVLLIVGVVRVINSYLPGDVWATYLLLGALFLGAGLLVWSTRRPKEA